MSSLECFLLNTLLFSFSREMQKKRPPWKDLLSTALGVFSPRLFFLDQSLLQYLVTVSSKVEKGDDPSPPRR